jgi:hypothetical protein
MDAPTLNNILDIVQGGTAVVLSVILYLLWQEFKAQNAFIRDMLTKAELDRKTIAAQLELFNSHNFPSPPPPR